MAANQTQVQRWDIFELRLNGPETGNPFLEVSLKALFQFKNRTIECSGFYDGDGVYRIRFMPDTPGTWRYRIESSAGELAGREGEFQCVEASGSNHGPVGIRSRYHFAYADGTAFHPIGTTCYAWVHQGEELEKNTLATLRTAPFNKIRMCVFPKHYAFNENEPPRHIFEVVSSAQAESSAGLVSSAAVSSRGLDTTRFNPDYFRHLEKRIGQLRDLGIEADIVLFHAYDRWGYADMGAEADDRYLRYTVARLAAFRNVWWSLANEYDLMKSKSMSDWDRFFRIVREEDPHGHLRSIHNCRGFYDHGKPWITHQSIQYNSSDMRKVAEWREQYQKPLLIDECGYEGNIHLGWGNLPARELVCRCWEILTRGGYPTCHGETYVHPQDILWWSKGGALHGESPKRLEFLRQILDEAPSDELEPVDFGHDVGCVGKPDEYYLLYFGIRQPAFRRLDLPEEHRFIIDVIDTWEMNVQRACGSFSGKCQIELPGKPYVALRIVRQTDT